MSKLFKPQAVYLLTLIVVVIAVTLLLLQACGGGGGYVGSLTANEAIPNGAPDPVIGASASTAIRQDCTSAGASPAEGGDSARASAIQLFAPAGNLSLPCTPMEQPAPARVGAPG